MSSESLDVAGRTAGAENVGNVTEAEVSYVMGDVAKYCSEADQGRWAATYEMTASVIG